MIKPDDRAVSNVLSALLVTLIIVLAVGLVAAVALGSSGDFGQNTPLVDLDYDVTNESVNITHSGGDPVAFDQVTVIFAGTDGNETRFGLEAATNISEDGDGNFETGEEVSHSHSAKETAWIEITIIHESSNTIISDAPNAFRVSSTVQGPAPTGPPTPGGPPSFASDPVYTDQSKTSGGGQKYAEYNVTYDVTDPAGGAEFNHVTVTIIDSNGQITSETSTAPSGYVVVRDSGNPSGQVYDIEIEIINGSGIVEECRIASDSADGVGSGNMTTTC